MNIFVAFFILFIIVIAIITAYVLISDYKQNQLRKLFIIITNRYSTRSQIETAADRIIKIMHNHKIIYPPSILSININSSPENLYLAYIILKTEIKYLIKTINSLREQKGYLNSVPPENRSKVLEFISETEKILNKIDFFPMTIYNKTALLAALYRAAAKQYSILPDENNHYELNFIPLFEIIDKIPGRTIIILPYFPYSAIPA